LVLCWTSDGADGGEAGDVLAAMRYIREFDRALFAKTGME